MEKEAGAKKKNLEIRKSFCLAAENLLHEKIIYCLSLFIVCATKHILKMH